MKRRDAFTGAKVILLLVAVLLLSFAVSDLVNAMSPANCSTGGACIKISQTAVLIQGVNFVGTLWDAVFASVATVLALILDVVEHMSKA